MSDRITNKAEELVAIAQESAARKLNGWTSGNLSVRVDDGFLITPSAIPFDQMHTDDLVHMETDGRVVDGARKPSSEWPLHAAVFAARSEVDAIVHTHSQRATAFACLRRPVPSFHYMVAALGGHDIRCCDYATPGSMRLGELVVDALQDRSGCLMANHGVVAVGSDLPEALERADLIETLTGQFMDASQMGEVVMLSDEQMNDMLEAFGEYGHQ